MLSSGDPRFKLPDLEDVELNETNEEAADDAVEHAEGDVEKGCDRMATAAFNCFLFSMSLEDGDRVGEMGGDVEDDCAEANSSRLASPSSPAPATVTGEAVDEINTDPAPTLALELLLLRDFSACLWRKVTPSLALLLARLLPLRWLRLELLLWLLLLGTTSAVGEPLM